MSASSPAAPGQLGVAATPQQLLDYLGRLDAWLAERRAELDALDAQILATGRQSELTGDMSLAMALWQAAKTRQGLLLATWDSGRVGQQELEKLSSLIWGRLDAAGGTLPSAGVSLPEAGRLCDALVAQLRARLNTDPNATAIQIRLRDLRAQAERIRDQLKLEPPALAPLGQARLDTIVARTADIAAKQSRGGDVLGLLGALEADAAKLERDLIVGAARRREGRDLLTRAREENAELAAQEHAVSALLGQVAAAIWPVPAVAMPDLGRLGPMPNTAAALTGYLAEVDRVEAEFGAAQAVLSRSVADRDAAASGLAALQARAAAAGLAGDPTLTALGRLASERLTAAPVVLPVVQHLLTAYAAQLDFLATAARP
ncbi:MAG: hypothetical protein J0I14_15285 [Propionibacteriaceae bacterium]|nr:hypothetical protein [Propionibacteriaceae bacterium]